MNNRIYTILFFLALTNLAYSQVHVCGVSHEDQAGMISFVENFNKTSHETARNLGPFYIPVTFHMTANNDGSGRISAASVLDQMAVLIEDYKKMGFYLYIDDYKFDYLDNTSIHLNPGDFGPTIITKKDPNALDIFICQNANTESSDGTVLGFYSPSGDYIIIRNQDVRNATPSLTHELGHFFSLPHTFFGWENVYSAFGWANAQTIDPWDPSLFNGMYTSTTCGGSNALVELVDRSNCATTADRICDTPPDYNFGLGAGNSCFWDNSLLDRNGDVIDPQENNIMSYFGDCEEYVFTEGQIEVMAENFNSPARDHLQRSYIPDTTEITSNHAIVFPLFNEELEYYTKINFDWTEADGATHYLLTVSSFTNEVFEYITEDTEFLVEELNPNAAYFWEVRPFNDAYTNTTEQSGFFMTGSEINTSVKESELIQNISVYPNPGRIGQDINVAVSMEKSEAVTISLIDITGRLIAQENQNLIQGNNSIILDAVTDSGIYILKLDTEDGSTHKKIIIQ